MFRMLCQRALFAGVTCFLSGCGATGQSPKSLVDSTIANPPPAVFPVTITIVDHGPDEDVGFLLAGLETHLRAETPNYPIGWEAQALAAHRSRAASYLLYSADLVSVLRTQFPAATVSVRHLPVAQVIQHRRLLQSSLAHRRMSEWCLIGTEFAHVAITRWEPDSAGADVEIAIDMETGATATAAYSQGASYGGQVKLWVNSQFAGDAVHAYRSFDPKNAADNRVKSALDKCASVVTEQDRESAKAIVSRGEFGPLWYIGSEELKKAWFLDWVQAKDDARLLENTAREARVRMVNYGNEGRSWRVSKAELNSWTGDPATSPLKPLWDLTARSIARKIATRDLNQIRASALQEWSALYEPDDSIRATITPAAVANLNTASPLVRALAKIQVAEATLLAKITDETVVKPAAGPLGDAIRDMVRAQEDGREQYYSQVNTAIFTGVVGSAGGLATGVAGAKTGNPNLNVQGMQMQMSAIEVANTSLRLAVEVDEAASQRLNQTLAETIGPILLDLEGESLSLRAGSLEELRPQLKAAYDRLRQRLKSGGLR